MSSTLQEVRKTLKLAWPITLGMIGQHLFGLLDTVMLGHHSTVELAASSFVNNLCAPALVFMYGYSSSISVRVSQARGRGDFSRIGTLLKSGLVSQLLLVLISIGILLYLRTDLQFFRQTPEVTAAARGYMGYMAWSLLPLAVFMGLRQFSDGLERTKIPTLIISFGFLINTLLNYLLIYGNWGFPEMGIDGAGLATLISRSLMLAIFVSWLIIDPFYRPHVEGFWRFPINRATLVHLFHIGLPSSIQYLFEVGIFAGSAILMGWFGTETLAAHQVVMNLATVTFMLPMSLSIATSVRVGHATGRGDWPDVSRITWSSVYLGALAMTACGVFFLLAGRWIPTWFTSDVNVIAIASQIFIIAAFFQVFDGTQSVLVGALRGTNDVKIPTAITFVAYWVVGGGLAVFLGFTLDWKHIGIWTGLALSLVVAAIALAMRFRFIMRKRLSSP